MATAMQEMEKLGALGSETRRIEGEVVAARAVQAKVQQRRQEIALQVARKDPKAIKALAAIESDEVRSARDLELSTMALQQLRAEFVVTRDAHRAAFHREMVAEAQRLAATAIKLAYEGDDLIDKLVEILAQREEMTGQIRALGVVSSDHAMIKLEANQIGIEYAILGRLLPFLGGLIDTTRVSQDLRELRLGPFTETRLAPVEMLDPDDAG
jgi:hypothetical protein